MEEQKISVEKAIEKEVKKVDDLIQMDEVQSLIKSNVIEFKVGDVEYRVSKPTSAQRKITQEKRLEKFISMMKDVDDKGNNKWLTEEELRVLYLKRGINLEEMSKKIYNLQIQKERKMEKLGELLEANVKENELNILKKDIEDMQEEISMLSTKKMMLLESSIENQIFMFIYSYLAFLICEKKVGDKWERVWTDFNEYENADDKLLEKVTYYSTFVIGVNS